MPLDGNLRTVLENDAARRRRPRLFTGHGSARGWGEMALQKHAGRVGSSRGRVGSSPVESGRVGSRRDESRRVGSSRVRSGSVGDLLMDPVGSG